MKQDLHGVLEQSTKYGCRVDWVRLVNNMGDHGVKPTVTELQYRLWELAGAGERQGTWKPWRCDKYVGWSLGQWSIGWSGQEYMVEVRSDPAHQFWIDHARHFSRCTRLDIAYDIGIADSDFCLADMMKEYFHASKKYRKRSNLDPIDYGHYVGRGKTWGLGKRSSSAYFRCYDKSEEQKWPIIGGVGRIWRLELECKRGRAQFYHDKAKGVDGPYLAAKNALYSYLKHFMFCPDALDWGNVYNLPYQRKDKSNVEKTLNWLERNVRPALDRLIDAGYAPDVLERLDLLETFDEGGPIYGETRRSDVDEISHRATEPITWEIWGTGTPPGGVSWDWSGAGTDI